MEQLVRVYRPQVTWILLLASQLRPRDASRERAFAAVLEGRLSVEVPLSEARRRESAASVDRLA